MMCGCHLPPHVARCCYNYYTGVHACSLLPSVVANLDHELDWDRFYLDIFVKFKPNTIPPGKTVTMKYNS